MPKSTWKPYFKGRIQVENSQKRQNLLQVARKVVRTRIDDLLTIFDGLNKIVEDPKKNQKYLVRILPEETRKNAQKLAATFGLKIREIMVFERTMRKVAYANVKRDSTDGSLLESSKIYLRKKGGSVKSS